MMSAMVSNRLTATSGMGPSVTPRARPRSNAMMDNAEYSPVEISATGGPGLAGIPG